MPDLPGIPPSRRRFARAVLIALAYGTAHRLGYFLRVPPDDVSAIWPAAGVALGVLLSAPRSGRATAIAALIAGNVISSLSVGNSPFTTAGFLLCNAIEAAIALAVVERFAPWPLSLRSVTHIGALVVAATIANGMSSLAGAAMVARTFGTDYAAAYVQWWTSDGLGMLLVTPVVVAVASQRARLWPPRPERSVETATFLLAWSVAAAAVFHFVSVFVPLPYVLLALLAWASLRLEAEVVALAICILAAVASTSPTVGYGPSPLGGENERARMLLMQAYLGVTATMGLLLTASRQEAYAALRRAREGQEQVRSLADHLPNGVVFQLTADEARPRFLYISGGVTLLTGITNLEAAADPERILSLILHDDRPRLPMLHAPADVGHAGRVHQSDVRLRALDGRLRHVTLSASIRVLGDGRTVWDGIVLDVTEQRAAEEALEASEAHVQRAHQMELVGQLAGGVAHDFNNLLTVIIGETELLAREKVPEPVREGAGRVIQAAQRAALLTQQLLAVGRRLMLSPVVFDLNEVVSRTEHLLRTTIGESVTLRTSLAPAVLRVKADQFQIERVLLNLALNARHAMPEGGVLTLSTGQSALAGDTMASRALPPGPYVFLSVADTGTGMPPEVLARIFEPFYTTKPQGVGSGLGLAAVDGIMRQSGGFVAVASEPGRGSAFTLFFPSERSNAATTTAAAGISRSEPAGGRESLLLVEDNAAVRSVTETVLRRQGYTVVTATSGAEALELAAAWADLDLLVTDVMMPGMSGRELAERLRSSHPRLKALFVSGYASDLVAGRGVMTAGANFLQKPFTPMDLAAKVREIIDAEAPVS